MPERHVRILQMKNIQKLLAVGTLLCLATTAFAADDETPIISGRVGKYYYSIGGGKVLPPPSTRMATYRVAATFRGGIGYSCGKFDLKQNVKAMFNEMEDEIRELPNELMTALTGAVMSLPAYALKKASPSLYGLINKYRDDYIEIFRLNYKTCEQIEREIRDNEPGYNPYGNFMSYAVAEQWEEKAETSPNSKPIDKVKKEAEQEAKKKGFKWLNGERYGGEGQKSINIDTDIAMAGYNYLLGRTKANDETPATNTEIDDKYIAKIWATPLEPGKWIGKVVGTTEIRLDDPTPRSEPGVGLRPEVEELTGSIRLAIYKAVQEDDFTDIRTYRTSQISVHLISAIRQMSQFEIAGTIDKLASELAVEEVQKKVILAKQLLHTGLMNPDVNASKASGIAHNHVRNKTISVLEANLTDIHKDLDLKRKSFNTTALKAIEYIEQQNIQNVIKNPTSQDVNSNPLIDGRVKK